MRPYDDITDPRLEYTAVARPRMTDGAWRSMRAIVKDATLSAAPEQVGSAVVRAAAQRAAARA